MTGLSATTERQNGEKGVILTDKEPINTQIDTKIPRWGEDQSSGPKPSHNALCSKPLMPVQSPAVLVTT